ncbi:RecQ family ATP-dependent DNA helicase [Bacillus sp. FJAT-27251]|uniref:RecQ family ATP-dependent DNA helicase n=1 Tax=Bacillus sp. FJAT-27251 TaxID=1684142 RepID=UPI0006A780D0|nr:RecQ family ATP-dependent DNA helicase [Bacillus sp. FJAT-27251]
MKLEQALNRYFQFPSFKPGQKETIQSILAGRHAIAMLPTGTGKSLCYQLPGYMLDGPVLIVSPLLSLMQDQVEQLKGRGEKRVVALNSFLTPIEKRKALSSLQNYKFIFISPEMLGTRLVINKLKDLRISLIAVDEAHCISQWGYDFRPDYLKLGEVRQVLGNPATLALTATATREVRQDIARLLKLDSWDEHVLSVDRPEISMSVEILGHQEKLQRAFELVSNLQGPGIIYFSSRKMAEYAAAFLRDKGEQAMAYHGGLDQESRILIQQQFLNGQFNVVCATSAFGMGINKGDIRYVIHYHLSLQLESYLQEIGRAGRDGDESLAVLLYAPGDEQLSYQLAEAELPEGAQVERLFALMREKGMEPDGAEENAEFLSASCGFSETQWRIVANFLKSSSQEPAERLKEQIGRFAEKRLLIKKSQIENMVHYILHNGCKREYIHHHFGEKHCFKVTNCCSFCGLDFSGFRKKPESPVLPLQYDWKKELASMLLAQAGDFNE